MLDYQRYTKHIEHKFTHAFGFSKPIITRSGSESILCSLLAIGTKPGEEVIVPVSICQSVINAIIFAGAIPVLVDIDENLALSPVDTLRHLNPKTKAIIYFHPFGMGCDLDWLIKMVSNCQNKIFIIEDCAQAIGTYVDGISIGKKGDLSIFSFGRNKPLSIGIGGMICVNNESLYENVCHCCRAGVDGYPDTEILGLNSTLSLADIQALDRELSGFHKTIKNKLEKAKIYQEMLSGYGNIIRYHPKSEKKASNIFHRVILRIQTQNHQSVYEQVINDVNGKLAPQGIFSVQPTIPVPPYAVNFVNEYYLRMERSDLIDFHGEGYPQWRDKEYRYLYLRTNEFLRKDQIRETCNVLKETLSKTI